MSKRDEGASITTYMDAGYAPEAVRNYLCMLGWSPKDNREKLDIEETIQIFDLEKVNRRNAHFDLDKCFWINGQYLAQMSIERFRELSIPFLEKAGVEYGSPEALSPVLAIVKEKIKHLTEVPAWVSYFFTEDYAFDPEAKLKTLSPAHTADRLKELSTAFESSEPWDVAGIEACLKATAARLGIKTGELVHPTRVAVSGRAVGPSLYHMLEVLGRDRTVSRMRHTADSHCGQAS